MYVYRSVCLFSLILFWFLWICPRAGCTTKKYFIDYYLFSYPRKQQKFVRSSLLLSSPSLPPFFLSFFLSLFIYDLLSICFSSSVFLFVCFLIFFLPPPPPPPPPHLSFLSSFNFFFLSLFLFSLCVSIPLFYFSRFFLSGFFLSFRCHLFLSCYSFRQNVGSLRHLVIQDSPPEKLLRAFISSSLVP